MDVEFPFDPGFRLISAAGPGGGFLLHLLQGGDAPTQTLFGQYGQFNLRHIEPASVLGGEVPFDPLQQVGRPFSEGLDQRPGGVGVEVVEHQVDRLRKRPVLGEVEGLELRVEGQKRGFLLPDPQLSTIDPQPIGTRRT